MPRTSYETWHCDVCGEPFTPTLGRKSGGLGLVRCDRPECRAALASRLRREQEARKFEQAAAGRQAVEEAVARLETVAPDAERAAERPVSHPEPHGRTRGLVISDLHSPFQEERFLEMALATDADWCIIVGDPMEQYAFSRFVKFKPVTWQEEETATREVLTRIAKRFERVICIPGNHDARLVKSVANSVPPAILHRLLSAGHALDPLAEICEQVGIQYPRKFDQYGNELSWMHQIGDAVFLHGEIYSSTGTNFVPRRIEERLRQHAASWDLKPWRLAAQAHTHNLSWTAINAGQLVVETGCLCQTHGYQTEPTMKGLPQRHGWVTLEQRDGVTDLSSVRVHWADEMAGNVDTCAQV